VQIPWKCTFIPVCLKIYNSWLPLWISLKGISKEIVDAMVLTVHNLIVLVPWIYEEKGNTLRKSLETGNQIRELLKIVFLF
jgi:hypothetical protein